MILPKKFYLDDTVLVAKQLLGKILIREKNGIKYSGIITETEAYTGRDDPASHSFRGKTERNKYMFEQGGITYIYFIYGNHFCFNIVTGAKNEGSAVLIRSIEPMTGIKEMKINRNLESTKNLTNGPGKLCQAFRITKGDNGIKVYNRNSHIRVEESEYIKDKITIRETMRIGISKGEEKLYRFYIEDNTFVTSHKFNKQIWK